MQSPAQQFPSAKPAASSGTRAADSIEAVQRFLANDLELVNQIIYKQLSSRLTLIHDIGSYIVNSGGKRLRPMLVLLTSQALGYQGNKHYLAAAIIELIHTATLLHDDVVDNANLRRYRLSAPKIWGNNASVLVGDFLYSRTFQMTVQMESLEITKVLANTTNTIAEGEVQQLIYKNRTKLDEKAFFEIIRCKTAVLYAASTHISGLLADVDAQTLQTLYTFGLKLGMSFQLIDDILDYADSQTTGKELGRDLSEGKLTLPVIYALKHAGSAERKQLEESLAPNRQLTTTEVLDIANIVRRCGGLEYTHQKAVQYLQQAQTIAQDLFPFSDHKHALMQLISFLQNRSY